MKHIILILIIFYSNLASAQHYKQIDIERECLNCGTCGITLQMRWGEHQGKLYDTIRLAYFRNQKISMTKFKRCADEIAQVLGFRYDGTLEGNLKILNTCCPYNFEEFFSDELREMIIEEQNKSTEKWFNQMNKNKQK